MTKREELKIATITGVILATLIYTLIFLIDYGGVRSWVMEMFR